MNAYVQLSIYHNMDKESKKFLLKYFVTFT